ncbi:sulfite exporter TauE/SafE family protein [Azorhizobium doebereinerae]|uniref:sulfite exporter TauE/SafE family protein n=1 Tax=Azorhizobium doebereinerae TaxID=281091 RepID=UPI00048F87A7|nr:sulfite exporter TauE/SafE family protein [Azorhizobium doebereinerae]
MLSAIPWSEVAVLIGALLAGGVASGILAGLLGVGGGGIIVPVLYEVFRIIGVSDDVRMQLCIGTSLAIIIPTSIRSFQAHKARGLVVPGLMKALGVPAVLGVIAGSALAGVVPGAVLQGVFIVVAVILAAKSIAGRADWRLGDTLPGPAVLRICGFVIGMASSMIGIAGGGLATILLTLYGVPIHAAVATSAGIGIFIPIPGVIGYAVTGWPHLAELPPLSIGYVSVLGFLCMAPVSTLVAPLGARLAHALPRRALEVGFGLFLLAVAARFLAAILWG